MRTGNGLDWIRTWVNAWNVDS